MKNNGINFWKAFRDRVRLKRALRPQPMFLRASKESFLFEIEKNLSDVTIQRERRIYPHVGLRRYALLTIGIIIVGNIGTAVIADAANVSFDHPLYAYKRLDESVRAFLSPAQDNPVVHTQLAERRLSEIQSVLTESQTRIGSSSLSLSKKERQALPLSETEKKVQRLTKDLQEEVDTTLQKAKETEKVEAKLEEDCDRIQDILEEHKKLVSSEHVPELNLSVFQKYCSGHLAEDSKK